MKTFLLDTSALLALRDNEAGAARLAGATLVHKDPEFGPLDLPQETLPLKA